MIVTLSWPHVVLLSTPDSHLYEMLFNIPIIVCHVIMLMHLYETLLYSYYYFIVVISYLNITFSLLFLI